MLAITRAISDRLAECQLTHLERQPIDLVRARRQHAAYEEALRQAGCRVWRLECDGDLPDSVFIEDTAVVLDQLAVITRPGAPERQPETAAVARALGDHRPLAWLKEPACLDGGDVLRLGRTLYVGVSRRSNQAGVGQLEGLVAPYGYQVRAVPLGACLHLKTAVTQVAAELLLLNPDWVDPTAFPGWGWLAVDPQEPMAANALQLGPVVIYPEAYPRTAERLGRAGLAVRSVAADELARAEGGVTCCSLILAEAG